MIIYERLSLLIEHEQFAKKIFCRKTYTWIPEAHSQRILEARTRGAKQAHHHSHEHMIKHPNGRKLEIYNSSISFSRLSITGSGEKVWQKINETVENKVGPIKHTNSYPKDPIREHFSSSLSFFINNIRTKKRAV